MDLAKLSLKTSRIFNEVDRQFNGDLGAYLEHKLETNKPEFDDVVNTIANYYRETIKGGNNYES